MDGEVTEDTQHPVRPLQAHAAVRIPIQALSKQKPQEAKLDTAVEASGCLSLAQAQPCQGPMELAKPSLGPDESADEQRTFS